MRIIELLRKVPRAAEIVWRRFHDGWRRDVRFFFLPVSVKFRETLAIRYSGTMDSRDFTRKITRKYSTFH